MSLWLCLRFDVLPLQALPHRDDVATVVIARQRVVACNTMAADDGVLAGQRSAIAQQLLQSTSSTWLEQNPKQEQQALDDLLGWAYSFSPTVERWQHDCILLEVSGSLLLFGGLQGLLDRAAKGLSRRGFSAQVGVAQTRRAAWLASYADHAVAIDPSAPLETRFATLPLTLLNEFAADVSRLQRAGLHTLGDLLDLPSRTISARCSNEFCQWLAFMKGTKTEVNTHYQPPKCFTDSLWFGFEIRHTDELIPAMTELLHGLCQFLRQIQHATGAIHWQLARLQGATETLVVRSDCAGLDWRQWLALSQLRLERLTLGRDIEGITLQSGPLAPITTETVDLFNDRRQSEPQQALIDRLRSRLGLAAIAHIGSRSEHLPEHCVYTHHENSSKPDAAPPAAQRPFWLLPQPQPIREQKGRLYWNGLLTLAYGPERIEDHWWRTPSCRDYYIAERENGAPTWIFHDRHNNLWYLHGLFD